MIIVHGLFKLSLDPSGSLLFPFGEQYLGASSLDSEILTPEEKVRVVQGNVYGFG
jgi:hypothetical protein